MHESDRDGDNLYRPSEASIYNSVDERIVSEDHYALASRGSRLVAVILESMIYVAVFVPFFFIAAETQDFDLDDDTTLFIQLFQFFIIPILLFMAINIYLLYKNGQTIGKKIMGIKIVNVDGSRSGLARIIGLRFLVGAMISNIPLIGAFFSLVDVLFIFREDRRCIHDLIAGTVVVDDVKIDPFTMDETHFDSDRDAY